MRRYGETADLTAACLYLASEDSNYMTGASMVIDGGWTCE
jgi:3-oxoacyl-[acyl-carrier protein] reductase